MSRGKIGVTIEATNHVVGAGVYQFTVTPANKAYIGKHQIRSPSVQDNDFAYLPYVNPNPDEKPDETNPLPSGDYLVIALGAGGGSINSDHPKYMTVEIHGQVGWADKQGGDKYPGFTGTCRYALRANPGASPGVGVTSYFGRIHGTDKDGRTFGEYLEDCGDLAKINFFFQQGTPNHA